MGAPRPIPLPRRPGTLTGLVHRQNLTVAGLALVAIVLAALIGRDVLFPPAAGTAAALRTASVVVGNVRSTVSGTGTLVPAAQQNVSFRTGGQLTEVDVKVGDHVRAGQVLAKIDTRPLQAALDQAEAALASAQANLDNTLSGNALQQAQHSLAAAQQAYNDTVAGVNLTNSQDQAQLSSDQAQLSSDRASYWYQQYQPKLTSLQARFSSDGCSTSTAYAPGTTCYNDLNDISCIQGAGIGCPADEQQIGAAYKAVIADQSKVTADSGKLAADQQSGQQRVNSAQNAVTAAQDQLNSQAAQRPNTIQQQQAAVQSAQAQVDIAQLNLDGATLKAPMDGIVTAVNGEVGDTVGGTAPPTPQAPGTSAPLPSPAGSTASGGGSSGGGSAFIVLSNDQAFQAVVPLAETDAARVQSLQSGTATFDAISNLTIPVHVVAVAPSSTVVSNVVNYNVTVALDRLDPRLRSGMTTNVSLTVASASDVVVVPNSAITRVGPRAFVTVLRSGQQVRTPVELGITGDSTTEITSGVKAGDRLVLPQLRAPTTTPGGRGGFGGGGVRLGD